MSRKDENTGFVCTYCGKNVSPLTNGSYRNHCPHCLYSLHVDDLPGDRSNPCGGLMKPVGIQLNNRKGIRLVHRCEKCGAVKFNRAAFNTTMPDDFEVILQLMKKNRKFS